MPPHNPYLAYRRDTGRLIYWIIQTSNAIIGSASDLPDDAPKSPNTNGQVTVASLLSLVNLVSKQAVPVPNAILALFHSVIEARRTMYESYLMFVAGKPDPEMEQSNRSHKHFLDVLSEGFKLLGSDAWLEGRKSKASGAPNRSTESEEDDDIEDVLFSNKFAALKLGTATAAGQEQEGDENDEGDDDEDGSAVQQPKATQQRRHQSKPGKGKKGKKAGGKKRGNKQARLPAAAKKTAIIEDIPVESYRIIQDTQGIVTMYLMANYTLAREWITLRGHLQSVWRNVAYEKLPWLVRCRTLPSR